MAPVCIYTDDSLGMARVVFPLTRLSQHSDVSSYYKSNYYLPLPFAKIKTNTKLNKKENQVGRMTGQRTATKIFQPTWACISSHFKLFLYSSLAICGQCLTKLFPFNRGTILEFLFRDQDRVMMGVLTSAILPPLRLCVGNQ